MHNEAMMWVAQHASELHLTPVLEIGGRNINGTVRDVVPATDYTTLDIAAGNGVDIVANAATWTPDRAYALVVCCEVFEHTPEWPAILDTVFDALLPGGLFVATMAGPGRPEHSGIDGLMRLHPGEYYGNVWPDHLHSVLTQVGFVNITVDRQRTPSDVRCVAQKPDTID